MPIKRYKAEQIVTMLVLIRSMIAAKVDDLPEPVGPVTNTMPLRKLMIFFN